MTTVPAPSELRAALAYNPETGLIVWRPRSLSQFGDARAFATWNGRYAGSEAGTVNPHGYLRIRFGGRVFQAHRIIWAIHHGVWPIDGLDIDHINGVRTDNRIANLRVVSRSENMKNRCLSRRNKSGVIGVSWDKKSRAWCAKIMSNGKNVRLGNFATFDAAVAARADANLKLCFHQNHGRAALR